MTEFDERITVLLWEGGQYPYDFIDKYGSRDNFPEPDRRIEVPLGGYYVFNGDPYKTFDWNIHVEETLHDVQDIRLDVHSVDSVRSGGYDEGETGRYLDEGYWGRPVERGLDFRTEYTDDPFGCEVWGRVAFAAEEIND